jgi:CubicO group peptidase (beta-lactamase class C family)
MLKKILLVSIVLLLFSTSFISAFGRSNINNISKDFNLAEEENSLNDNFYKKLMRIGHIPSLSIGIVKNDELVIAKSYGEYDLENNKIASPDTLYMVNSVSKPFIATALMQLYEQDLFDLDDDVSLYLPFNLKNPKYPNINITFRMLLAHQSSLAESICDIISGDSNLSSYPYPWLKEYLLPDGSLYTPNVWRDYAPGEKHEYSNMGYGILGYLIEQISGLNFNEYIKQNIFIPLGMVNSSFHLDDINTDNAAVIYDYYLGRYIRYPHYEWFPGACGNLRTSINELSKFLIAHMNDGVYKNTRILNKSSVELMHKIQYPENKVHYGLGFEYRHENNEKMKILGHTGYCTTSMWIRPHDDSAIIMITNLAATPSVDYSLAYKIPWQIYNMVSLIMEYSLLFKASRI